jgi:precorrin-3B synthase
MKPALRKGWCPSVLRPMASGDGLIVRVSNTARLSPQIGRALARLARRFGNGLFDLSARGNLQLRGVSEATLAPLQQGLRELGLAAWEEAPSVARNILASPLAGLDPHAVLDITPCVEALRDRLTRATLLHRLPAKFGFVIDDAGTLSVASEQTDVSFLARRRADTPYFVIGLAGLAAGECAPQDLADVAFRIARAVLELSDAPQEAPKERMAGIVRRLGTAAIAERAGLAQSAETLADARAPRAIGAYRVGRSYVLGLGIAFGRLEASRLDRLAASAAASGGELRLTPWRTILIVGAAPPDAGRLAQAGLILSEDDPLRAVVACPGALGCANGTTPTHEDARRLAPLARRLRADGIAMHVSGCAKGCAHPGKASATFVGRDGRYDLVRDGTPADRPIAAGIESSGLDLAVRQLVMKDGV